MRTWPVMNTVGHRVHHRVADRRDEVRRAGAARAERRRRPCRSPSRSPRRRGRRRPRGGRGRGGCRRRRTRRRSGRFAPPGSPNTTSTPSALRHSITASTARMRFPLSEVRIAGTTERAARRRLWTQCNPNARASRRCRAYTETGGRLATPARRVTGSFDRSARTAPRRPTTGWCVRVMRRASPRRGRRGSPRSRAIRAIVPVSSVVSTAGAGVLSLSMPLSTRCDLRGVRRLGRCRRRPRGTPGPALVALGTLFVSPGTALKAGAAALLGGGGAGVGAGERARGQRPRHGAGRERDGDESDETRVVEHGGLLVTSRSPVGRERVAMAGSYGRPSGATTPSATVAPGACPSARPGRRGVSSRSGAARRGPAR